MDRSINEILMQLVGKKYNVLRALVWVSAVLLFGSMIAMPVLSINGVPMGLVAGVMFFSFYFFIIVIIIYSVKVLWIKTSLKTLKRTGKLGFIDEIISGDYNTNGKICFSKHLLYDKKAHIIVAYDDIVWVFKRKVNLVVMDVIFRTIDGKEFRSKIDDETLLGFLDRRSGILVGYRSENEKEYRRRVKEFKNKK